MSSLAVSAELSQRDTLAHVIADVTRAPKEIAHADREVIPLAVVLHDESDEVN